VITNSRCVRIYKIGASKRKGIWVGGKGPPGYEVTGRKVMVAPEEAERVRTILQRYLRLGSICRLMPETP